MSEKEQETKSQLPTKPAVTSRFWRTFLVVGAAFLTFAAPTYVVYVFLRVLNIDYAISMVSGLALFIIGLTLIEYLIKKKAIT